MVASASVPRVSVVIPSFNRRDPLLGTLDALAGQTYPRDRFDVVVSLDGSTDGSREALQQRRGAWGDRLRVLWQPNQGAGRARNRGAELADGEILLFLDDDILAAPDLVAAHARAHRQRASDVVLGRLLLVPQARAGTGVVVRWEQEWYDRHFVEMGQPGYLFACWDFFAGNVSLTRQAFWDAGGFDETFTNYGCEDWELGLRLLKAGCQFSYCAEAVGEHRYGVDFAGYQHHAYWDGRSEVRFARKYPEIKAALQLGPYYQGSLRRRLVRRTFRSVPAMWPATIAAAARLYGWAEGAGRPRLAARLLRLVWGYRYWRGLCDELGGPGAADGFVGFRVPILLYHRVTDAPHPALAEYAVSPATFRRQLSWLRGSGHHVVSLSQVYDAYRGAAPLPPRPVVVTFDDGYQDAAAGLAIMRQFGYPATLFVVADRVGGWNDWDADVGPPATPLLGWEALRELAAAGTEIGGHSATHPRLPRLSDRELDVELRCSRAQIEQRLGRAVRWFAYPHGEYDPRVRQATQAAGYQAAFTIEGGLAAACDDLLQLPRIPLDERDGVVGLACKLATGDDWWTAVKRRVPLPVKRVAWRAQLA